MILNRLSQAEKNNLHHEPESVPDESSRIRNKFFHLLYHNTNDSSHNN